MSSNIQSFYDYIQDKKQNLHKQLYDAALQSFKKYAFPDDEHLIIKIFEYKNQSDILEPSDIIIWYYDKDNNVIKQKLSLERFWNNEYINHQLHKYPIMRIDADSLKDAKIIDINYIKGEATLWSRYTGYKFNIPLLYVDNFEYDETYKRRETSPHQHFNGKIWLY